MAWSLRQGQYEYLVFTVNDKKSEEERRAETRHSPDTTITDNYRMN
jgi:hypothetical protein